ALILVAGGLGAAAFHPPAAALAHRLGGERRGFAMSVYITGGTLGFSLGPLFAVTVVGRFGLERTWLAAIPGLVVSGLLLAWFSRVRPQLRHAGVRPELAELRPFLRPLSLLYLAVVCRSAVSYGFMTFLPIHLHAGGYGLAASGMIVTLYLLCGALGGFLGGWLADRWGGRNVVVASFFGGAPLYLGFLLLPDPVGLASLVLGSFVLQTSLPVNVVMGQELSPRHASTISSLLMGAAWGMGALIIGPIGVLADARGLHTALLALAGVLGVGLAGALGLPDLRRLGISARIGEAASAPGPGL
ncbi:MAG TPA: MFS transporter, partial [Candidatus Eisenbacteria bacterium]